MPLIEFHPKQRRFFENLAQIWYRTHGHKCQYGRMINQVIYRENFHMCDMIGSILSDWTTTHCAINDGKWLKRCVIIC